MLEHLDLLGDRLVLLLRRVVPAHLLRSIRIPSRTIRVRLSISSPRRFSASTCRVIASIVSCSFVIRVDTMPLSPIAADRAWSESSFFSCEFSRFCFSICAFCFRTTFATSSAYDFLSPSIMRYRRCSSSSSASRAGAEVEGPDSLMVECGAGGGGVGSGGAGVRAAR